jgi:hypothetical protein
MSGRAALWRYRQMGLGKPRARGARRFTAETLLYMYSLRLYLFGMGYWMGGRTTSLEHYQDEE